MQRILGSERRKEERKSLSNVYDVCGWSPGALAGSSYYIFTTEEPKNLAPHDRILGWLDPFLGGSEGVV